MQTRKNSLLEALVNILSGAILAFIVSQSLVISSPLIAKYLITGFHFELSMGDNIFVTFVLTCVSIIRSYLWRRYFNKKILERYKRNVKTN